MKSVVEHLIPELAQNAARPVLEVVVDRSHQNGLRRESEQECTVYDVQGPATATRGGMPITLGLGVRRRIFAVCERTDVFGDWLVLPDLAAHLWGHVPQTVERIRGNNLLSGIEKIGTLPGTVLLADLNRISQRKRGV